MAASFLDFEYNGEQSDIIDNAMAIVTYANGIRAGFNLCMFAPLFYEELILCGDEGRLSRRRMGLVFESYFLCPAQINLDHLTGVSILVQLNYE